MNTRMWRRLGGVAGAIVVSSALTMSSAWACPSDGGHHAKDAAKQDVKAARHGTSAYHDSKVITTDSHWFQLYDVNGITCIDDPAGGMGIHFVNGDRLGDPSEIASQPEAVIYEPQKNGKLRLVAVEYVVTKSAWEGAGNTRPPSLYGQDFELVKEGNRYGLPDFYELHAWIWRHNPNGLNEDWNPKVSCDAA
jgi:hypothetical protein